MGRLCSLHAWNDVLNPMRRSVFLIEEEFGPAWYLQKKHSGHSCDDNILKWKINILQSHVMFPDS